MSENLLITLGVQDKGASKQITALNKELRYLDKEFKTTNKTSKEYEYGTETLKNKLGLLEQKYDVNKNKLNAYKQKMQEAEAGVKKKKEELEKLNNTEGVSEKAIEKTTNQLNSYEQQLRDATREVGLTDKELDKLEKELKETELALKTKPLDDYTRKMDDMGNKAILNGQKLQDLGGGLKSMGDKLTKYTLPIMAATGASGAMYLQFKDDIENINTLLDDESHLEGYEEAVKRMSRETGIDTKTMSEGMYQAISSLGDLGEETESIFEVMGKAAKAGKADVSDSVALISSGMKGFGQVNEETAKKISDLAFNTTKLGTTTFPELAKNMSPLFPLAEGLGISLEELFGVMATGTGVTGDTAAVTTQFKAVMSNLMKPTTEMTKVIKKYGFASGEAMIEQKGLTGVLEILQKETGGSASKLAELFSSTEALTLVSALCGAQYDVFNEKLGAMTNAAGATDKALGKVSSTTKDKLTVSVNKLKVSFMEAGEKLEPMFEMLSEKITELAEWLGSLDAETVKNISSMAAMGLGLGVTLKLVGSFCTSLGAIQKVGGGTIKTLGKLTGATKKTGEVAGVASGAKGFGSLLKVFTSINPVSIGVVAGVAAIGVGMAVSKTNSDLYAKSVNTTSEELTGFEKVVAKFNGTQFKTQEELERTGIKFKEFGEGISEEFQVAVEMAHNKSNEFQVEIQKMNGDGVISEEDHANFVTSVTELCDGAINTVRTKGEENQIALKEMFNSDNVLTEEEIKTLESLQRITDSSIKDITERKAAINEIEQIAFGEKRELNAQELIAIQEHQQRIRELELQALGGTQEEILYAKNEFASRLKTMSAEQASEMLVTKQAEIEAERVEIESSYDTQIAMLQERMGLMTDEERANAEISLANLIADKDSKLGVNSEMWQGYLDIVNEKNPELLNCINQYTGEELTQADLKSAQMLEKLSKEYEDLETITADGSYRLYNTQSESYRDLEVMIDERSGNIVGIYDKTLGKTGAASEDWAKQLEDVGKAHGTATEQISDALKEGANATLDNSGNISLANKITLGSLEEVSEGADGTKKAIIELNGEKVEISTNADGTIKDIDLLTEKLHKIPTSKDIDINYRYKTHGTPPRESSGGSSRSIEMGERSLLVGNFNAIPSIPSMKAMPTEFATMETSPSFYSGESPVLAQAREKFEGKADLKGKAKNDVSGIDYNLLAKLIAEAVAKAVSTLKIEPIIENSIDGEYLSSKVSNNLAIGTKRRR